MIGILGAGQLGRMLALAGYPLGRRFRFLDPAAEAPAGQLAEQIVGDYADPAIQRRFLAGLEAVTYEFENVPVFAARALAEHAPVFPPPAALEAAQDRLQEKTLFQELGLPTPPFYKVNTRADLEAALEELGLPAVLKTRRLGYDGKGQSVIRVPAEVQPAWEALAGAALILEGFIPFERELSIIAVRGRTGETAFYPLVENHHREGILRLSIAPAPQPPAPDFQSLAQDYARRVLHHLDYIGVLAIELFQQAGQLLANEMAPRVHNSGHWTIEGAATSQFENHLRAGLGLPLGSTAPRGFSAMINLIGTTPAPAEVLAVPGAHLHLYGKTPRAGRKLGHITVCAETRAALQERLEQLRSLVDFPQVTSWASNYTNYP